MVMLLRLLTAICLTGIVHPAWADEELTPKDALIEIILDEPDRQIIEREMILATIRGQYTVSITLEELTIPRMRDFEWIQLARDEWTREPIDGVETLILERRVAFFPQRSGALTLRPVSHSLTTTSTTGDRTIHVVQSQPVALTVEATPAHANEWWLPATAVEVTDSWNKDAGALTDRDTVKRRVTLRALGATEQMLPPQPALRAPWLITFTTPEQRTTELTDAGPLTTVTWEWTLRPKTGEPGVLAEVQIPWFDTINRKARIERLQAAPIAYAGFGENSTAGWQSQFRRTWLIVGAGIAGALLTVGALAPGGRLRRRSEINRLLRNRPLEMIPLYIARWRRDVPAFRRAALATLDRSESPREDRRAILEPIDRFLFGPGDNTRVPDFAALMMQLWREGRTR